jgi:hypothetical protein
MNTIGRMQELSMGMNSSTTDSPRSSGPSLPRDSGGGSSGSTTSNNGMSPKSSGGYVGPNNQSESGFRFNYDAPKNGSVPAKGTTGLRGGMGFGGGGLFNKSR